MLPCESQNTENVILQRDSTKEKLHQMFHSFISGPWSSYALNLLIRGVIHQSMYETKIHDINNLRKCLIETWLDFDQDTSLTLRLTSGFII